MGPYLGLSEPVSNGNDGVTLISPELEPHHKLQFTVILGIYTHTEKYRSS